MEVAITLVRSEKDATLLDSYDLHYIHKQLKSEFREKTRAEKEFPSNVNVSSEASQDRCFMEVDARKFGFNGKKIMFFSKKEAIQVQNQEKEFLNIWWLKLSPIQDF